MHAQSEEIYRKLLKDVNYNVNYIYNARIFVRIGMEPMGIKEKRDIQRRMKETMISIRGWMNDDKVCFFFLITCTYVDYVLWISR